MSRFHSKRLIRGILLATAGMACWTGALAAPTLDQSVSETNPTSSSGIGGAVLQAQTFTVGLTGTLVELQVLGFGGNANLFMDVRGTNGAQPSDTDVRQTVNVGAFAASGLTSIPVNVPVTAGDFLSFVFYFNGTGSAGLSGQATTGDPYPGGGLWTSGNPPFGGGSWYPNGNNSSLEIDIVFNSIVDVPDASGPFSMMVVPDTQMYAERYPAIIDAQMQWIVSNESAENIIYVSHLGDMKDGSTCDTKLVASPGAPATIYSPADARSEWEIIDQAFDLLDANNIPYGVLPGNHDFEPVSNQCVSTADPSVWASTAFDEHFGPGRFSTASHYGDTGIGTPGNRLPGRNIDNFTLFGFGGVNFIAINLAYRQDQNPADSGGIDNSPELTWADNLLKSYPDRLGIVTSHYFMDCNSVPGVGDCASTGPLNNLGSYAVQVYSRLSNNPNLFVMMGAHEYGEAYRRETRAGMQPVHILLSDYQRQRYPVSPTATPAQRANPTTFSTIQGNVTFGNSGFMRIMRFDPATGMVNINTFSPGMAAAPAVAGTPDVPPQNCTPGNICGTGEVSARTDLPSTYTPTITGNPALDDGLHPRSASNLSFSFQGYVPSVP